MEMYQVLYCCQNQTVTKANSNSSNTPSTIDKLIIKAVVGSISSSKTGSAAIITIQGARNLSKTRECGEWEKQPIINRWKCIKFRAVALNN